MRYLSAVGRELHRRPLNTRLEVVEALDSDAWIFQQKPGPRPPVVQDAAEAVLAGRLADAEVRKGMGGTRDGKHFSDPRICDMAAHLLVKAWKRPDLFDLSAEADVRDRQIERLAEIWAKSRGKELPEPPSEMPVK